MKPCYSVQRAPSEEVNLKLTNEIILADIEGFKKRITAARVKLEALPSGQSLSWKEKKKHRAKRRDFEGEIEHVNNLIAIARSAMTESHPG